MKELTSLSTTPTDSPTNRLEEVSRLVDSGQIEQAQTLCEALTENQPDDAALWHMRGVIAYMKGQAQQAVELIGAAIKRVPDNPLFFNNHGNALRVLGRFDDALASFDKAIKINPDFAEAYYHRGITFQQQACFDEAMADYDNAIALKPDFVPAHCNRGVILQLTGQLSAAITSYEKAIEIDPNFVKAHINRGNAAMESGNPDVALASYATALKLAPSQPYLFGRVLYARHQLCDWGGYSRGVKTLKMLIKSDEKAAHPFPVLSMLDSPVLQQRAAETWMQDKCPIMEVTDAPQSRVKGGRIRIGYFSSDFREHAVSYLTAQLFETHDKSRFELFGFSFTPVGKDVMGRRIASAFEHFFDVTTKTDREVAELSRQLGIDIAIDLNGHTMHARPGIFSFRAAPVQTSYIGYLGSMGAPYFDYLIADRTLVPDAARGAYPEKIAFLPCYQVNDGCREIAEPEFSRTGVGLPSQGFVFCCFSLASKITPTTFDSWMQILRSVDDSVLWLFDHGTTANENLRNEAVKRGVSAARLVFAERLPRPQYLARYQMADLFLDTSPYNAGTMASDALWAGLPVLSLQGKSIAARMGSSVLAAIDLPELIADSQRQYARMAIELAVDEHALKKISRKLKRNRNESLLFDCQKFTRYLETAYQLMHERQLANLSPDDIVVEQ